MPERQALIKARESLPIIVFVGTIQLFHRLAAKSFGDNQKLNFSDFLGCNIFIKLFIAFFVNKARGQRSEGIFQT